MRKPILIVAIAAVVLVVLAAVLVHRSRGAGQPAAESSRRVIFTTGNDAPIDPARLLAATTANPGNATAWARLGDAYLGQRDWGQAIDAYKKAVAIDPSLAATWSSLGEAYVQTEQSADSHLPPAAADAFRRTLALNPRDLRARFYQTMDRDFSGEHDRAVGEWLAMLREAPMGSEADISIRAALGASMNRNIDLVRAEMSRATAVQPRLVRRTPDAAH